jgi:hypothetical protein
MYKILSNILLSRLTPYAEEIIGDHQCEFRRSRSTTDHIFCIRKILEKKLEYNEAVHQLFIDYKKAYDSLRRVVLSLIEFGIPMKITKLIQMCLAETYSRVWVGKNLSDTSLKKSIGDRATTHEISAWFLASYQSPFEAVT